MGVGGLLSLSLFMGIHRCGDQSYLKSRTARARGYELFEFGKVMDSLICSVVSPFPLLLTLALMSSSHLHPLAAIHQERVPGRHKTLHTLQTLCVLTSYDLISILFEFDKNARSAHPLALPSLGINSPDVSFIRHIYSSGKPSLPIYSSG